MMFNEVPFLDRFKAASEAGFTAVEFLFPYEFAAEEVAEKAKAAGVRIVLFNLPPGNWASGERGITGLPGREQEFRDGVEKALKYAQYLGVSRLHAMAGVAPAGSDLAACRATLVANLKYAAQKLAAKNLTLLLEAINTRDIPGFLVTTQESSHAILEAVAASNLKMQMDLYHMQVMEGDLATKLKRYQSQCGHIQVAGCPERNEPDTGEVRYEYLFQLLDEIGYSGWVGCEYRPRGKTTDGLGWFRAASRQGKREQDQEVMEVKS
jgi:hydroxypyruvate isomerase